MLPLHDKIGDVLVCVWSVVLEWPHAKNIFIYFFGLIIHTTTMAENVQWRLKRSENHHFRMGGLQSLESMKIWEEPI